MPVAKSSEEREYEVKLHLRTWTLGKDPDLSDIIERELQQILDGSEIEIKPDTPIMLEVVGIEAKESSRRVRDSPWRTHSRGEVG